eukprot:3769184-Alexandrium_andersonii.AAC.1
MDHWVAQYQLSSRCTCASRGARSTQGKGRGRQGGHPGAGKDAGAPNVLAEPGPRAGLAPGAQGN